MAESSPQVAVIMGSSSDWSSMKACSETLEQFGVPHECKVSSAHRTPDMTADYIGSAEERGIRGIIAAAGGAAHLAGVCAAHTVAARVGRADA